MGSQTKYGKKDLVYVNINIPSVDETSGEAGEPIKYGFFTNIPAGDRAALGQTAIPESSYATPPTKLVIGCSFPKPKRASKRTALRFTSSFVARDKVDEAKRTGWSVSPAKANSRIILASTAFVQSVYVEMLGIKYGWNIPKVTETNAGSLTGLGIRNAVAGDRDELCFGSNFPRPPRAKKLVVSADDIKNISTFYDPSSTLPEGWTPAGGGRLTI